MNGDFTQFPAEFWKNIQMNAGMIVRGWNPTAKTYSAILGATGGGLTFNPNPTFEDFGADIDNVPPNTKQLKRVKSYDPSLSGTFKTMDAALAEAMCPGINVSGLITPADALDDSMFEDVTIIADYSDVNKTDADSGAVAGYMYITLHYALNVTGYQWKTNKDGKGEFPFDYHGHYDLNSPDDPPFEIGVIAPTRPSLTIVTVTSAAGTAAGDTNITVTGYTLKSGEKWMYKTGESAAPTVTRGQRLQSDWLQLTSGTDITPAAGHTKLAVAAVNAAGRVIGYGSATIVKNTTT